MSRSTTGKYYASLLCDDGMEATEKPTLISNVTGLDMRLAQFAIKSDDNKIANPRHLINASHTLRRKQKALSRKKKGSANRRKARIQLAVVHERVANARADFQHKLSRAIVDGVSREVTDEMERFILSGICFYELNGLRYLLQEAGYSVFDEGAVKTFSPHDVFVLALSAEPLLGWGRHVQRIRHYRRQLPCRMVVLVPPSLSTLRVFDGTCPVISGHLPEHELITQFQTLCQDDLVLPRERQSPLQLLNVKQGGSRRQLLQQYRENTPLNRMAKSDYYHRGRLLDTLGIQKMQTLSIVGQELLS